MTHKTRQKHVFLISLILTILVFSLGLLISYGMDFIRIDKILIEMNNHKLATNAYLIEKEFIDTFGGNKCQLLTSKIYDLKKEAETVGSDLSKYGEKSFFKKRDFDYLKRKYFLLELKLYALIHELNAHCAHKYIPILFFYKIDHDLSERQGYVLSDLAEAHKKEIIVFSFDKDYEDEPLLKLFLLKYNITKAPTVIINDQIKIDRIVYLKELAQLIKEINSPVDIHAKNYNFDYVLTATGTDKSDYIEQLDELVAADISNFAKGDIYLVLGRLTKNDQLLCRASTYFKNVSKDNPEQLALAYETIASLNCNKEKKEFYLKASDLWKERGNYFRAELDKRLANETQLKFYYSIKDLPPITKQIEDWEKIIIGNSYIKLDSSDLIVSQTDRVSRDWLSYQFQSPFSNNLLTTFSERLYLNSSELLPAIGWHEGARIKELKQAGLAHKIASGTIVKKIGNNWYAPDEKGIFKFQVPLDKIMYPTTRFLKEDLAVIIDTHGINMIVEQAIRHRATIVIGCCDHPGKIKAAKYLSDNGIKVICFTDKYLPQLLFSNAAVLGSPPITKNGTNFILGKRPIEINRHEKIIVMNSTNNPYAIWYYQTPTNYFSTLSNIIDLNLDYVLITDFNQMDKVITKAEQESADIIAVRTFNSNDYFAVKEWLEKDSSHKAILFHSTSYPYGYKLLKEFPSQTSFDDINPIII